MSNRRLEIYSGRPDEIVNSDNYAKARAIFCENLRLPCGVLSNAMRELPMELFYPGVPAILLYGMFPILVDGKWRGDPVLMARMLEPLALGVGEIAYIGAGEGYWAALLGMCGHPVMAFEIDPDRAERARAHVEAVGLDDIVTVACGDGLAQVIRGDRCFGGIFVDGALPPTAIELLTQRLYPGGLAVIPVGGVGGFKHKCEVIAYDYLGDPLCEMLDGEEVGFCPIMGTYAW